MATLVLTAVGTVDRRADRRRDRRDRSASRSTRTSCSRPRRRQGPRLGDLAVQTSSYGTPIPKIFGTMRVAGTVIWATDLAEHRSTSGGKGRPKATTYSYSASFAVALSARPVGVGAADLGGRQAAARRRRRLQERDRLSPACRRRGPGGRPADRRGGRGGAGAGLSRASPMPCSRICSSRISATGSRR